MNKSDVVSVIITTHKREPEIVLRAINSVLQQTHTNIEIIVVDDSPSLFSLRKEVKKEIEGIKDNRLHYIQHEMNKGACVARNTGLDIAKGEFIAFLDDDDVWHKQKLEKQLKKILETESGLVYCRTYMVNKRRGTKKIRNVKFHKGMVFKELLRENFIGSTSFPLIKKVCFERCGYFDETLLASQDYDLWLRISREYSVDYLEEPLVDYYVHEDEAISKNPHNNIQGIELINKKYYEFLKNNPRILGKRLSHLAFYYGQANRQKEAFSIYSKSLILSPFDLQRNIKTLLHLLLYSFKKMIAVSEINSHL